jgi:serine/threonine protein phosphatase PrpC
MTLALHYALRSDVGLLREGNEDSAYAGPHLLAIADGMGGHAAGEVASAVAISAIAPLDDRGLSESHEMLDALAEVVAAARETLHEMSEADPATEGMGTTLTALLWSGAQVAICHIGDSRAYLLRDEDLYQITRDHTLIQSLVDEGRLSPAAAANHPQRSLIMRALQGSTDADPDLSMHTAELGDRYLLCSDGLTDVVSDEAVHQTLVSAQDPAQAVEQLIDQAIKNGGPDNITCIVADVVDTVTGPVRPSHDRVLAGAAAHPDARTSLASQAIPPAGTRSDGEQASANGYRTRHGGAGAGAHEDSDFDAEDGGSRRRWPIVTTVLVVLVLLVGCGLLVGWRYIQGQYYVDADGGQVSIYRGVSQSIAWMHFSSVYKKTGIPFGEVPAALQLPTDSGTLAQAQQTVTTIQRTWGCKQDTTQQKAWQQRSLTYSSELKAYDKLSSRARQRQHKPTAPGPEPTVPAYCAALLGVG